MVPAWRIVAAELDAQVDQQPGSNIQEPVTGELPIGPDRPDDLWSISPWTANQASGPTC